MSQQVRKAQLKSELSGIRGSAVIQRAKHALAHAVGRAFYYDHLSAALEFSLRKHEERNRPLVYWEFGTGAGSTLQRCLEILKRFDGASVVLFDSFEGLPAPEGESDAHVTWEQGSFAFDQAYLQGIVNKVRFPKDNVQFVKGFFKDSLTPELGEQLGDRPPAFVTIDVDYYSSTRTVLDFIGPLLWSGCNIYFDDLWSFDGHPGYGQLRAITEFNEGQRRGRLVPNPIFHNGVYSYFNWDYEFISKHDS